MMDQMFEAETKIREIVNGSQVTDDEIENLVYMAVYERKYFTGALLFLLYSHRISPNQADDIDKYVTHSVEIAPV